jgi:hypothetical protein
MLSLRDAHPDDGQQLNTNNEKYEPIYLQTAGHAESWTLVVRTAF